MVRIHFVDQRYGIDINTFLMHDGSDWRGGALLFRGFCDVVDGMVDVWGFML